MTASDESPDTRPDDAIVVRYVWTPAEVGESQRLYAKAQPFLRTLSAIAVGSVFALYGVFVLATTSDDTSSTVSGVVLIVAGVFLVALRTWLAVWIVERRHAKDPDAHHALTHRIDAQGVHTEVPGLASSRVTWEHFMRAVIGERGTLLFLTPRQYQWVPHHALSDEERARLEELVSAQVPQVDRV